MRRSLLHATHHESRIHHPLLLLHHHHSLLLLSLGHHGLLLSHHGLLLSHHGVWSHHWGWLSHHWSWLSHHWSNVTRHHGLNWLLHWSNSHWLRYLRHLRHAHSHMVLVPWSVHGLDSVHHHLLLSGHHLLLMHHHCLLLSNGSVLLMHLHVVLGWIVGLHISLGSHHILLRVLLHLLEHVLLADVVPLSIKHLHGGRITIGFGLLDLEINESHLALLDGERVLLVVVGREGANDVHILLVALKSCIGVDKPADAGSDW